MKLSWTQPCCDDCWVEQEPNRVPVRVVSVDMALPEYEQCAWCGQGTLSGIYKRADPRSVLYPAEELEQ